MNKLKSDLLLKIQLQGYCTVPSLAIDHEHIQKLYENFDQLIQDAKDPALQKQIVEYDDCINRSILNDGLKLNMFDLSLGKIFKGGAVPHVTSFLFWHHPLRAFSFSPFLTQLEEVKEKLKLNLNHLVDLSECIYILKISKYSKADESSLLMPFHFDRTLLTVIVDTQESTTGNLAFQRNEEVQIINSSELPLIFTGKEGFKTYGIAPISHGVVNFSAEEKNPERFSLILFVLLKNSLE